MWGEFGTFGGTFGVGVGNTEHDTKQSGKAHRLGHARLPRQLREHLAHLADEVVRVRAAEALEPLAVPLGYIGVGFLPMALWMRKAERW